jgi:histidinol-phosphate aminotransferase
LFCEPSIDSAIILEPTYGVYRVAADLNRVRAVGVELDDVFQIDVARTLNAVGPTTKLIFCCSPNNPTGNPLRREDILAFTERFNGVVVVDEAYVEFSSSPSLVHDVAARENLVVLRTLSKAWGLAGIRVGYCIAHPLLVEYLLRIKSPYNVNAVSSALALNTLECDQAVKARVRELIAERDRLGVELTTLPIVRQVYPSNANFLLVRFADSARAFAALLASGVVVRRRSEQRLHECLRITVGTPQENEAVLNVLSELEG